MYLPAHFAETRIDEIKRIVENFPLATIVGHGASGLSANHIPFLVEFAADGAQTLLGHIARNNPLKDEVASGDEVMVIYRAQDSYVSPNWYPTKPETHRHVPTWNYQAVHFYGTVEFVDDEKYIRNVVGRLTKLHEAALPGNEPWKMSDAPADYMAGMVAAVVGVRITVTRMVAKSKLSQNRVGVDFQGVTKELDARGAGFIATSMAELKRD